METANDLARLAIRTCGGQGMLKSLPRERIHRDSRCGSLMLPWTAELCIDRMGRAALYEDGEVDEWSPSTTAKPAAVLTRTEHPKNRHVASGNATAGIRSGAEQGS